MSGYQVRLVLHYGSGASNGSDVYLNGHCDANFSDVRFTEDDGTSLLDHWLEKGSLQPGDQTVFWVEFDSISTAGTDFYVYYGNPSASSASDGEATWDFFDDFEGTVIDTAKWDEINTPNGVVSNSELYINKTVISTGIVHGYMTKVGFDNCRMLSRAKTSYNQTFASAIVLAQHSKRDCANKISMLGESSLATLVADTRSCSGSNTVEVINENYSLDTYYTHYYVRKDAEHIKAWVNGAFGGEVTSNIRYGSDPGAVYLQFWGSNKRTQDVTVDWFAVGKYCAPEPTFGSWTPDASEPTPTPSPTATIN